MPYFFGGVKIFRMGDFKSVERYFAIKVIYNDNPKWMQKIPPGFAL
jgi:hypothetical protein